MIMSVMFFFIGVALAILAGCGSAAIPTGPDNHYESAQGTVVILGSSTAAGRGPINAEVP